MKTKVNLTDIFPESLVAKTYVEAIEKYGDSAKGNADLVMVLIVADLLFRIERLENDVFPPIIDD